MKDFKMLVAGQLVSGAATIDVINPATGEILHRCPRADEAQLNAAVASAKAAFPEWSRRPVKERAALLTQITDAVEARIDEFAALLTAEQGKPLNQAKGEMFGSIAVLREFAKMDLPLKILRETAEERIVEQRTGLGVVGAIVPWNFPMILMAMKVAPALIAGNTIIVKPAPTTPLTTLLFGEICADILPAGVLSTIVDANDLGAALTAHPDIAKIAFTGSTATGKKVMQGAAGTLKRLTLELGGNDAAIVLDDMEPREAAARVFGAAMLNSGQICLAAKRAYVPEGMYDQVVDELSRLAKAAIVDDGARQGSEIGPVQNRQQFEKLKEFLADAHARGTVVAGGAPLDRPGYFIPPTIVRDIPDDARLVREEQFGPVLPVLRYSDIDDVIRRANDTEYGLGATIWTSDPERGFEIAMRIDSGTVWVNKHLDLPPDVRVGGAKQSGIGAELGLDGLLEFTQAKIINMSLAERSGR